MKFTSLRHLLETRAAETPDKTFLFSESDGGEWTYAEFDAAVNRTANMLVAKGIRKGDVVSLLMPNSPEYIAAYFACWKIGALAGPVNSLLKPDEVEWIVGNSESKLMLVGPDWSGDRPADHPTLPPTINFTDLESATVNFPDTIGGNPNGREGVKDLTTDDEAIIIYTSGTTGKPKGCLLTHGNLLANAEQITNWMGFGPGDRLLTIMPLFHMNAVTVTTMTALFCGGSTVVSPKFSASRFWDIIEKYRITSFGSVVTMLSMLLRKAEPPASAGGQELADAPVEGQDGTSHAEESSVTERPASAESRPPANAGSSASLKFAMCGSAPVPAEILKRFEETFGVLVIEGYGLSESTCRSTFNPPNENRRPGSCGQPIGNEMKVVDEEDNEVPDGELGEIVLRGPNILKGYFKNPEATAKAFAGGWFHTGDIGYRDADGFFYIADRKSDMIIRGGENIYPREIDDLLYTHPAVAHAAVIGVPDELYGEEVAAFIVLKDSYTSVSSRKVSSPSVSSPHVSKGSSQPIDPPPQPTEPTLQAVTRPSGSVSNSTYIPGSSSSKSVSHVSAQDIIDFCKLHLADFKCPKTVHFVADIPKGPTGKLLKRELARLFAESRTN
jgi:acyl-CoA synthetase (AMP-forming)/AMP-acid ligase II